MFTLVTGAPGTGKTAQLVKLLGEIQATGRPCYVDGIPDLTIDHTPIDALKWHDEVPDGAAIFIAEAQRLWPPTGPSQRVLHPSLTALNTHRHRGIDFFVDTQHPKLLNMNVRAIVGRHIVLRDLGILGRHWYEWTECADPSQWRTAPIKARYRLPKKVFGVYKSASEHIKPIRRIPPALYLLALLVPALLFLVWRVYSSIADKHAPPVPVVAPASASPAPGRAVATQTSLPPPVTAESLLEAAIPRLADQPNTAPMYDEVRRVVSMPRIGGGYCIEGGSCRCYMQRGYRAPISDAACRTWLKEPPFDAYYVAETVRETHRQPRDANPAGPGGGLGVNPAPL